MREALAWTSGTSYIHSELIGYASLAMPLYVRDDRVKELADRVAALSRSTVTDAVRVAFEERLRELDDERAAGERTIDEILAKFDAGPDLAPGFTDKDLYDENGDPIL
jgi:hypothetical protein